MVRCRSCEKSFKQHFGKCWDDGQCGKCAQKSKYTKKFVIEKNQNKSIFTPVDIYLDQFVFFEMKNIDN